MVRDVWHQHRHPVAEVTTGLCLAPKDMSWLEQMSLSMLCTLCMLAHIHVTSWEPYNSEQASP